METAVSDATQMGKPMADTAQTIESKLSELAPAVSLGHIVFVLKSAGLKESAEKRRRFIRDANDLVRCLTVEFEIEFGLRSTVVPVGKTFKLAPSQASLRERGASDDHAHARSLPG